MMASVSIALRAGGATRFGHLRAVRRAIAPLPAFRDCRTADLQRIAQWGDLLDVDAGVTLLHEGKGEFWFFSVMAGSVRLTKDGDNVALVGAGGHVGHQGIVGLRPQPATVTTAERSTLFALGPRYFLTLYDTSLGFRRALFPELGE